MPGRVVTVSVSRRDDGLIACFFTIAINLVKDIPLFVTNVTNSLDDASPGFVCRDQCSFMVGYRMWVRRFAGSPIRRFARFRVMS
jgi:hypothetical protein